MTSAEAHPLRAAAAVAAIVLSALSRGDALVLAIALILAAGRPPALAVLPALVASSWRWGSTSLEALAGAQAVLGPAGWVGPASAASASWLAAVAIVLAVPTSVPPGAPAVGGMGGRAGATGAPNLGRAAWLRRVGGMGGRAGATGAPNLVGYQPLLVSVAAGVCAGAVVAGPAPGGQVWARAAAGVVGTVLAVGVGRVRSHRARIGRALDGVAAATSMGAIVAVSQDAPGWAGTIDTGALGEGIAIAVGTAALLSVAEAVWDALRNLRA